jgi:prepilin-type N-terminal cleavage/methylation domain-containing protein
MHPSRTRAGFTLIELLTVIAIIAILMGLLLPAMNAAKNAAKKSAAKTDLTQLVNATKSFYTDYGVYPVDPSLGSTQDQEYGAPSGNRHNSDVINVLRADTNPGDTLSSGAAPTSINTREVVYLDVPLVKNSLSPISGLGTGKETNGISTPGEWYDPFGGPYIIDIDANYDGYVDLTSAVLLGYKDPNFYLTFKGGSALQTGVIAGSFGGDHVQGSKAKPGTYSGSDDVLSWE